MKNAGWRHTDGALLLSSYVTWRKSGARCLQGGDRTVAVTGGVIKVKYFEAFKDIIVT